jgi:predicted aldo/keto reductase-like oxidoreductase
MTYIGETIKKLGFGFMRLPLLSDEVDIEQTRQMVDIFMENGFSYFDTAPSYLRGKSEEAIKTALVDRYPRERYQLATKLPAWEKSTAQEAQNLFWTSLGRTGVDYFDFYLLHNMGGNRTDVFEKFGIWEFLAEQKNRGRIKHLGFSFHSTAKELEEVLQRHPEAEFVQLQINYADWEDKIIESRKCYEVARKYNKPIIVMEPVKGGTLAKLPAQVARILLEANPDASLASWAIRFSASLEGVIMVLSGMSTLEQMMDNLSFMKDFRPLGREELAVIERVQKALAEMPQVPCTGCQYCVEGCPQNIDIPVIFKLVNEYLIYRDLPKIRRKYVFETRFMGKASDCIACGQCEAVCPQRIPIREELSRAARYLETP